MRALSNYRHPQTGFTLIELVMVIVILGILSAVAIPKFVDLRSDAQTAATLQWADEDRPGLLLDGTRADHTRIQNLILQGRGIALKGRGHHVENNWIRRITGGPHQGKAHWNQRHGVIVVDRAEQLRVIGNRFEDIVDTGFTLSHVLHLLRARGPKRLEVCALLDKPSRREVDVKAKWIGFEIPDTFVVGYGIDYAQRNRNLPYIGKVRFTE